MSDVAQPKVVFNYVYKMLNLVKELHKDMWVIFDLDGTLADIEDRRKLCTKENGKMDWNEFFNPKNISLDKPFFKIITLATIFRNTGFNIAILSGRSESTKDGQRFNSFGICFLT